ncbi:hypothetical protein I302_105771 [Kwoniella bestiolae CBS 10118]|uniref:Uncharacterized protein n=1 Tax=Kwoniella bestiolae CBS 10118 TaxID=1296100 RepID=A0AAJ8KA42_9TREE
MGKFSEFLSSSSSSNNNNEHPPPPTYNDSKSPIPPAPAPAFQQQQYSNEPPPPFPHLFGCLHLARSDRVRLIGLPQTCIPAVEEAIRRVWMAGIQKSEGYYKGWEWKLSGNPWYGQGAEAVYSRRLLCHIFHALSAIGWDIHIFNESDKIRIIDPPDARVREAFLRAVQTWPLGIQSQIEKEPGATQVKLRGNPWWTSSGDQVVEARLLVCTVLSAMESVGFELVGSVDMSQGSGDNNYDLDTWFFATKM